MNLSANGFQYRKRLDTRSDGPPAATAPSADEDRYRIDSAAAEHLVDSDAQETLDQINACIRQPSRHVLGLVSLVLAALLQVPPWLIVIGGVLTYLLYLDDERRRTFSLTYDLDEVSARRFELLVRGLSSAAETHRVWRVLASKPQTDWKRHGGASTTDDRVSVTFGRLKPPNLATNIEVWGFKLDDQQILFFPDRVLVFQAGTYGAVDYGQLHVFTDQIPVIVTGPLPADTTVLSYTWQYINKSGGPDRRFRDNRQVPIARYGLLTLASPTGLNIQLHMSDAERVHQVQWAIHQHAQWLRERARPADRQTRARPTAGHEKADPGARPSPPTGADPYAVLGVERSATFDMITEAFRAQAKAYHPDKVAHLAPEFKVLAETKMRALNQAYAELKQRFGERV